MISENHMPCDKRSFILGMIVAFCECVAGGCKRMALSPPLSHDDYAAINRDAYEIIERHGLLHYHERNDDVEPENRFEWIVIARRQSTLDRYAELRAQGISPVKSLKPFSELLSYNPEESVQTGYDAYRDYFLNCTK